MILSTTVLNDKYKQGKKELFESAKESDEAKYNTSGEASGKQTLLTKLHHKLNSCNMKLEKKILTHKVSSYIANYIATSVI